MIKRIENIHILLWLIKDISWCLAYKQLAVTMIIPTLIIGLVVTYYSRKRTSDLIHNISVIFWILANSSWMIMEFLKVEDNFYSMGFPGKWISAVFFGLGIAILLVYYTFRSYKWAAVKKQPVPIKKQELEKV